MALAEFALIDRILARSSGRQDIVLGIGDDAALLQPQPGQWLVVTADTLNGGVHFPAETTVADIGWKTLAVNLSDLAAMGATPAWGTLSLSLPEASSAWIDGFCDGFFALADACDWRLVGGDTTRGPLSLSVTAFGQVPAGQALRRDGANEGDDVWVSGTLGDAAGALRLWQQGDLDVVQHALQPDIEHLRQRLLRPTPRLELGMALRGIASAAVDVSDGLLADLGHIARRSGLAAQVDVATLPVSASLQRVLGEPAARDCAAGGGDDYELCFTASPAHRQRVQALVASLGVPLTRIGVLAKGHGVAIAHGVERAGYQHFS